MRPIVSFFLPLQPVSDAPPSNEALLGTESPRRVVRRDHPRSRSAPPWPWHTSVTTAAWGMKHQRLVRAPAHRRHAKHHHPGDGSSTRFQVIRSSSAWATSHRASAPAPLLKRLRRFRPPGRLNPHLLKLTVCYQPSSPLGMAVGKVPSGHTKPYSYPLEKNWFILILTIHHGYKITPYSYPP
jgi:hypothetical protein